MYNVGFGDCFLVTVATGGLPLRILFDCGSIAAEPTVSMDDVLERLFADATDEGADAPRIDVIVGTHRHRDHVSGFAKPGWDRVAVQEVWMPWTEDPKDPLAKDIRERQSRLAQALEASLRSKLAVGGNTPDEIARLTRLQELALNALSNQAAMRTLHEGFAGNPTRKFLPARDGGLVLDSPALPDVTVYVLGPSRDKEVIRDMDPPAGKSYLRLVDSLEPGDAVPPPFSREWQIDEETWRQASAGLAATIPNSHVAQLLGLRGAPTDRPDPPQLSPSDRETITELGELDQGVAVSLDKAVNGTSLMIVLRVGARYLLFPGDAQWGSWQAALSNEATRALLEKTSFYKVGHHGSHNATPVEFVEDVVRQPGLPAMISTRPIAQWPEIPRQPLIDALTLHGCVCIRSDTPETAAVGAFHVAGRTHVDLDIP
jgi:beta-lactamase superfamily II metal-dependent hydrolase